MTGTARHARRAVLVVWMALSLAWVVAGPARAHGGDVAVRPILDEVALDARGLDVRLVGEAGQLLAITHDGPTPLEVVGDDGRPFLRISRDGVDADVAAPAWYLTSDPSGSVVLPDTTVDVGGAPRWRHVTDEPRWVFADHRLHPADLVVAADVLARGTPTDLAAFRVPLRLGGVTGEVRGRIRYAPLQGRYRATLDGTGPAGTVHGPGWSLTALPGVVPGFFIDATADGVEVLGAAGEPFLRVVDGGVEANVASPTWQRHTVLSSALRPSSNSAGATLPATWERIAEVPRFAWLDERAAAPTADPPDDPTRRQTVATFTIPVRVDGRVTTAPGTIRWAPFDVSAPGEPPVAAVALAATGLALGGLALRRRRLA